MFICTELIEEYREKIFENKERFNIILKVKNNTIKVRGSDSRK